MKSARVKALDGAIRTVLRPALENQGFESDPSLRTFRRRAGECVQIVNVQVGVRAAEGTFTVNLAVFHPEYRENADALALPDAPLEADCLFELRHRLSRLRDTPVTRLARVLISSPDRGWKSWLVTPTDKWWRFTEDREEVEGTLASLLPLLLERGLAWLDAHSDPLFLRETLEAR